MTKDEALKQALEALEAAAYCVQKNYCPDKMGHDWDDTIASIKEALALPVQEPVRVGRDFSCKVCGNKPDGEGILKHGKGCYALDKNGGGSEFIADAIDSHLPAQEPVAWRRREVGGCWQYFGWEEAGMTYQCVERWNKNGFECEAIFAEEKNNG